MSTDTILSKDDAIRVVKKILERADKKELAERLYERLLFDEITLNEFFDVALDAMEKKNLGLKSTVQYIKDNLILFR